MKEFKKWNQPKVEKLEVVLTEHGIIGDTMDRTLLVDTPFDGKGFLS